MKPSAIQACLLPNPVLQIDEDCASFDEEQVVVESTLATLMTAFPNNRKFTHTHIKIIAISQLYRARVKNVDAAPLAQHIWSIPKLDALLAAGDPEAVSLIHGCKTTMSQYYSFATKFCSWHNQKAYSLWDYNVDEALWAYKAKDGFSKFKRQDLKNYPTFIGIVNQFRKSYALQRYSLKNIDKFLWQVGATLLEDKEART